MRKLNKKSIQASSLLVASKRQLALPAIFGLFLLLIFLSSAISFSSLLALELVVGLLLATWAVLRPAFALMLVFIGAGLPSVLLMLPGHTVRPVEPVLLLCMLVVILRRPAVRLRYYHLLALLFIGLAVISFIHVPQISTDPNAYAADKRLYEILLIFEAFFCGTFLARYVKHTSSLLSTLLLCNIPLYLIGLAQALGFGLPTFLQVDGAQDPLQTQGRLWGPTSGAVTFGLYLVNLLAVALSCYILGVRRRDRIIGGLMTIATTLELVGTGTRSAALGGMVMMVVLLVVARQYKLLLALLGVAAVLVLVFFNQLVPLFAHDQSSIANRLFLWQEALKLIIKHPWLGIGLQQFHVYYEQLPIAPSVALNQHGISVHNQYLELALESGIGWLVVAILLLFSVLATCWRAYRVAQPEQQALFMAVVLALLANMLIGCFDVPFDKVEATVVLFLLAGVAVGYSEYVRRSARRSGLVLAPALTGRQSFWRRLWPEMISSVDGTAPTARKTMHSITFQLICWGLTGPIMLPVTALLTHYLGPVQYGEYGFTLPFLGLCALLSGTGMDPLLIRLLSRQPRKEWGETLSYAAGSRLVSTTLSIGLVCLVALVLPISAEPRTLLVLGCLSLFFNFSYNGLRVIYAHGFRAEQRITLLVLLETADRLLTAAMVLVVVLFRLPLLWAYVLIIYADLPCCIALVLIASRRFGIRIRLSVRHVREHLLGSLGLTGYDALTLITGQADILLLMLLTGPLNVGLYVLAIRISDPLLAVAFMYVNGIYPLLCSTFEKRRERFALFYTEGVRVVSLAVIPLSIFVSMQAKAIVTLLGGQHFAGAAVVVQLLMWATGMIFYSQLAVRSCMAANMERQIPYIAGIVAGVNVLGNLVLIPLGQAVGAGIASLVSELLALLLFTFLLRHSIDIWPTLRVILLVTLGCVPAIAFLYWQQQASLLLVTPVTLFLIVAGCFSTGALSWKDIDVVRHFLLSRELVGGDAQEKFGDEEQNATFFNLPDVEDCPTLVLPKVQDIADYPTLTLPRIRV